MADLDLGETTMSRFSKGLIRDFARLTNPDLVAVLLEQAELGEDALRSPLDDERCRRLWTVASQIRGADDLGLRFAEHAVLQDLGLVGYIAQASRSVGDACSRVAAYERLHKQASQLRVEIFEHGARIIDIPPLSHPPWPAQLAEAILATWLLWPGRWAGEGIRPLSVCFQHPRPASTATLQRIFACPIEFGRAINAIEFSSEAWALPLRTADPLLARYLESTADQQAQQLARDDFMRRIEEVMVGLLPSGDVGATRVARSMGLSSRSLHRRLSERGLGYRELLDELRRRTATSLLEGSRHSVSEVAFMVGFSDPSGLRRAFRRWSLPTGAAGRADAQTNPATGPR